MGSAHQDWNIRRRRGQTRRERSQAQTHQDKVILFAFHLGMGAKPVQAYLQAGLWSRMESHPDYGEQTPPSQDEIDFCAGDAEELAKSSHVQALVKLSKQNPVKLLQAGAPMMVLKLMSLAFNAQAERVQFNATQKWLEGAGILGDRKLLQRDDQPLSALSSGELEGMLRELIGWFEKDKDKAELEAAGVIPASG